MPDFLRPALSMSVLYLEMFHLSSMFHTFQKFCEFSLS